MKCAPLPSGNVATEFVSGDWSKAAQVLGTLAVRGGIIAAALLALGQRKRVVQDALIGSAIIELSVLLWAASEVERNPGGCHELDSGRETGALMDGAPGALPALGVSWLGRAGLLTSAFVAAGTDRPLVKGAAASSAVQAAITAWTLYQRGRA